MTEDTSPDRDGFRALGVVEEPIDRRDRDGVRAGYRLFTGTAGFEAALPEHVLERALAFARAAAPDEWYGLLVGRLGEDGRGRHVVLVGVVPDEEARATPGFVETSHASEFATRALARRLYPDAVIVGWVHSHPHLGVRYSATDRRNQATWTQAHSLGIVVDPWDPKQLTAYRGPDSEELAAVPTGAPAAQSSDDASFRPIATRPTGPCRTAPVPGRPASGPWRKGLVTVAVAALLVALLVALIRRERTQERCLVELTRRVRILEARPGIPRCPTSPPAPPAPRPEAPRLPEAGGRGAPEEGRSRAPAHGPSARPHAPRTPHP